MYGVSLMSIIGRKIYAVDSLGNPISIIIKSINNKILQSSVQEREVIINLYFNLFKKE